MPRIKVRVFEGEGGRVPVLDWIESLPRKAQVKVLTKIMLLQEQGHELRRPHADLLRDGIRELRARHFKVRYRLLYFFDGRGTVVLSHGFQKDTASVPPNEIERAIRNRKAYLSDPECHTAYMELG
jgi:phage-related protein